jgi:hypothetical protein
MANKNKQENKKQEATLDHPKAPSCNVFGYEDLHQVDPKYVGTVNPDYNPGVLSRIKNKGSSMRTYIVKKPLYYNFHENSSKHNTKINIGIGEKIYFIKEKYKAQ